MKMPRRPRSHVLETASSKALENALPDEWVCRPVDGDYGHDAQVEVFENSSATGDIFMVQLKATDQRNLSRALSIRLRMATWNYYRSHPLPTLMVRYHAPTERLFAQWFHLCETKTSRESRETIALRLEPSHEWTANTPARLVRDVRAFSQLASGHLRSPLALALRVEGDDVHGVPTYLVSTRIREAIRPLSRLLAVSTEDEASRVTVRTGRLIVELAGAPCFPAPSAPDWVPGADAESVIADVMVAIALALESKGLSAEAAAIVGPFLDKAQLLAHPLYALALSFCLVRTNHHERVMNLAQRLFSNMSTMESARAMLIAFSSRQRAGEKERTDVAQLLEIFDRVAEAVGLRELASWIAVDRGHILMGLARYREAFSAYARARRLSAEHDERRESWRWLASSLFQCKRYRLAALFYARAISVDDERYTRILWADALMFAGFYADAQRMFERSIEVPIPTRDFEPALKAHALDWIRKQTGVDSQKRHASVGPSPGDAALNRDDTISACKRALASDALTSLAWYNLGIAHVHTDLPAAANCFLAAALIMPWDVEAWAQLVSIALKTEDAFLLGLSTHVAFEKNGAEFLEELLAHFPPEQRAGVMEIFARLTDYRG